jgi:hypothetical protein
MHKDILDALHDAVAVDPNVFTVAVVPIPVDPNPARADWNLLLDHNDLWRRWGLLRGSDGFGLLDDDHGLPIDLLGRTFVGFDDHIVCRSGRLASLPLSRVVAIL